MIQEKTKASQSIQKNLHDNRMKDIEFQEADRAFIRLTLTVGVGCTLKMCKFTPCVIKLFQSLKCVGSVAYQMTLLSFLSNIHNYFHVSHL